MSEQQPNALRLADLIEWTTVQQDLIDAAAELRRLHELNAELLEALNSASNYIDVLGGSSKCYRSTLAIAKATGER